MSLKFSNYGNSLQPVYVDFNDGTNITMCLNPYSKYLYLAFLFVQINNAFYLVKHSSFISSCNQQHRITESHKLGNFDARNYFIEQHRA